MTPQQLRLLRLLRNQVQALPGTTLLQLSTSKHLESTSTPRVKALHSSSAGRGKLGPNIRHSMLAPSATNPTIACSFISAFALRTQLLSSPHSSQTHHLSFRRSVHRHYKRLQSTAVIQCHERCRAHHAASNPRKTVLHTRLQVQRRLLLCHEIQVQLFHKHLATTLLQLYTIKHHVGGALRPARPSESAARKAPRRRRKDGRTLPCHDCF
ncbi:hypothetical protein BDU57DRAFT_114474 [Ampelomyces quisqualis]|uniref:Uncharacterized protein n=1 Tax=Ampelomyces quisqualis TaxID=50730 RepID=A0A6A5Q9G8_AMPQU|nr:hypothetical protein BDU57DRAFT_114474 [Ampelomyces quisqualis]